MYIAQIVLGSAILVPVPGSAIWVLFDARRIGVRKGLISGIGNMGPWSWFFVTLGMWIVAFPMYLYLRPKFKIALLSPPQKAGHLRSINAYEILGLAETANLNEIWAAYQKLLHQKTNSKDQSRLDEVNWAYKLIGDPNFHATHPVDKRKHASTFPNMAAEEVCTFEAVTHETSQRQVVSLPPSDDSPSTKPCRFCGEKILAVAIKCKHCGSMLDGTAPIKSEQSSSVLGIVAIVLGVASVVMPYFAAVFFVPAALVTGIVACWRGRRMLGGIAVVLAVVGVVGIISVSTRISEAQQNLERSLRSLP